MAQWDLLLTQNVHATLTEYSEKNVNLNKGDILSADTSQTPTVLAAGTDGYMLVRDDAETTGLKWQVISAGHTQNTDTGTDSLIFELDNDGFQIELTAESASKFGVKVNGGATYADIEAKDATFAKVTVVAAPSAGSDLTNKTYVDGLLAASDAMVFKGTVGTGGTLTLAAHDALTTYNAGDTYKIIEASADLWGKAVEIGDLIIAIIDRTGSGNSDDDWTVVQSNLDGAVIGPSSAADNGVALFDGTTGALIKDGGVLGTMAFATTTDYVANALFDANTVLYATADNTPAALTVTEQTIVGRITSGNIDALTGTEVMGILWSAAPATPSSTGTVNQIAYDDDYFYVCVATDTWCRAALALNWT